MAAKVTITSNWEQLTTDQREKMKLIYAHQLAKLLIEKGREKFLNNPSHQQVPAPNTEAANL